MPSSSFKLSELNSFVKQFVEHQKRARKDIKQAGKQIKENGTASRKQLKWRQALLPKKINNLTSNRQQPSRKTRSKS
jgi:phage-related minor tail protein